MRNGFRAYDSDTHVNPAAEVLDRYVDPGFRPRLAELEPYRLPIGQGAVGGVPEFHNYRVGTKFYRRVLGESAPRETFSGRETRWMGTKMPRPGVQDDQAENRVKDMDDEGTDVHFLIPTSWLSAVGLPDPALEVNLIRAYHRHMADFCGQYPTRLKSMIIASSRAPDEAVREIREWGKSKWAVAVMPLLAKDMPADHPDLNPVWEAAQEYDLPIANHSFTWNPPYYPGYEDLWENIFLGRLVHRRWDLRPVSEITDGRARMRLWLAAILGAAHGRAGGLCRRHRSLEAEAQRVHVERPVLLQHRASRGRGHVQLRHPFLGGRCADVCLRLSPLGMPVPEFGRQYPRLVEPQRRHQKEAAVGQRQPLLQADLKR